MNDTYDPKTLRKLQLAQCAILEDFIQICEKYRLNYFLFAGCAIGVERHQGFIPWDDDIDIGMPRDDYDRFLEIAKARYTDKYRVLDIDTDPKFPFYNAEFIRKGTKNIPVIFKDLNLDMGIDVAIYPFDHVADQPLRRNIQCFSVFFWHKIRILRDIDNPVLFLSGWRKQAVKMICISVNRVLRLLHLSRRFINKRYLKSATKYNSQETAWLSYFFGTTPLENAMKRDEIFPLKKKKFEYLMVNVPNKNDACLSRKFGDYMKIPPESKRKNHVPYLLEFGEFDEMITDL